MVKLTQHDPDRGGRYRRRPGPLLDPQQARRAAARASGRTGSSRTSTSCPRAPRSPCTCSTRRSRPSSTASRTPRAPSSSGSKNYTKLLSSSGLPADARSPRCCGSSWRRWQPSCSACWSPTLADRLSPRGEKTAKTIIFLPMAISAVGAGTVWRFVYAYAPGGPAAGRHPERDRHRARLRPGRLAASSTVPPEHPAADRHVALGCRSASRWCCCPPRSRACPTDTLEAAPLDGANERQIFRRVVVPADHADHHHRLRDGH